MARPVKSLAYLVLVAARAKLESHAFFSDICTMSHPILYLLPSVLAPPPGLQYTWGCAVLLRAFIVQLTKTLLANGYPCQARAKGIPGVAIEMYVVSVCVAFARVIHTFVLSSAGGKTLTVPLAMTMQ